MIFQETRQSEFFVARVFQVRLFRFLMSSYVANRKTVEISNENLTISWNKQLKNITKPFDVRCNKWGTGWSVQRTRSQRAIPTLSWDAKEALFSDFLLLWNSTRIRRRVSDWPWVLHIFCRFDSRWCDKMEKVESQTEPSQAQSLENHPVLVCPTWREPVPRLSGRRMC